MRGVLLLPEIVILGYETFIVTFLGYDTFIVTPYPFKQFSPVNMCQN